MYLLKDDKHALKSIIDALYLPYELYQSAILDCLFDIFFIDHKKVYADLDSANYAGLYDNSSSKKRFASQNLVENYKSFLLTIFVDAKLLEALVHTVSSPNKQVAGKAVYLLGELLALANDLLPITFTLKIQSLPTLFDLAAKFTDEGSRYRATNALIHIDGLQRVRSVVLPQELDDFHK
jgi:hypothetical protein